MADEEDYLLLLSLVVTLRRRKRRRRLQNGHNIKPKRFWVREIFCNRERCGEFHNLMRELRVGDREPSLSVPSPVPSLSSVIKIKLLVLFLGFMYGSSHSKNGTIQIFLA